jgi:hypothetical protein
MAFMAAAIPIAASVLGAMSKKDEQAAPAIPPPPSLGEIVAMNGQKHEQSNLALPMTSPFSQFNSPVGGGQRR